MITEKKMITAEEARQITDDVIFTELSERIKDRASKGQYHETGHWSNRIKEKLEKLGYTFSKGESGKHGPFDIIHW